jgi:hypothetical protein
MPDASDVDVEEVTTHIRSSDHFDRLVEEIAEHFHQQDYKNDRIPGIKASFQETAQEAGLSEGRAQGVAGRLIGTLIEEARQNAPPPPEDDTPDRPAHHPDEFGNPPAEAGPVWSLVDVARLPVEEQDQSLDDAAAILKDGVQRALIVLASVYAVDAARNEVPPSFTSQLEKALTSPSPGGLMNFLNWAAARSFSEAMAPLQAYINDMEKSGEGWFSRLSTLRNRWAHPDEYDVDATLDSTRDVLSDPPAFVEAPTLAMLPGGEVYWTGTPDSPFSVAPFLHSDESGLSVPRELEPPDRLRFEAEAETENDAFAETWRTIRVADRELEDPTPREFRAKVRSAETAAGSEDTAADAGQLFSFPEAASPGILVDPALETTVCSAMKARWPAASLLSLAPASGQYLRDPLPDRLGLEQPPSWQDLCSFQSRKAPYVFVVDTTNQESEGFLRFLYGLADLRETCDPSFLKFVLLRSEEQCDADQEEIWDRMPSHLDDLLYPPAANPGLKLPAHLWTPLRRFAWYKRPLLRIQQFLSSR